MVISSLYIIFGAVVVGLVLIGLIVAKLYVRSTKERAFVRTGLGGQKVISNGGAVVLPVFHEIAYVNMKTLRLEVKREKEQALITGDRMRVDVQAEFYVRVKPDEESIAQAAQSLGGLTLDSDGLRNLVEGKFVDALRSVASELSMTQLHEKRSEFVQKVQQGVAEDLSKNGLELESVSLTGLDQTGKEYFNPDNAFDAEGLLRLTEEIENRNKKRNDIEQETKVLIKQKNLEATKQALELEREEEYAILQQKREIEIKKAEQEAEISKEQADRYKIAENAKITAEEAVKRERYIRERETEEERIKKERAIQEADIEKAKAIKLAEQKKEIEISNMSKEESTAKADADNARAEAITAEEAVTTAKETAIAERQKQIEIIQAKKVAERDAIAIKVNAQAEKDASNDIAEAKKVEAQAEADAISIVAEAKAKQLAVEAEGAEKLNRAANTLDEKQIALQLKLALIKVLPDLIREGVKPLENIDSIKILETGGFGISGSSAQSGENSNSLSDQIMHSALKYKANAPLIDTILKEFGLSSNLTDMSGIAKEMGIIEKNNDISNPNPETNANLEVISESNSTKQ